MEDMQARIDAAQGVFTVAANCTKLAEIIEGCGDMSIYSIRVETLAKICEFLNAASNDLQQIGEGLVGL